MKKSQGWVVNLLGMIVLIAAQSAAYAASFSYSAASTAITHRDDSCNQFSMDVNGLITCSSNTGTAPGAISCTISPSSMSFVQNGTPSVISVSNCNPADVSYQWFVDGEPQQGQNAANFTPSASLLVGSHTVGVTVSKTGLTNFSGSITVNVTAPTGTQVGMCPANATYEEAVDFALDQGQTRHKVMNKGMAYVFRFTADNSGRIGSLSTGQTSIGKTVMRFMNLSETKCDFSYTNFDARNGCAANDYYDAKISYSVGTALPYVCTLKPNTTYYLNVRNEDLNNRGGDAWIDTCLQNETCGFVFGLW